MKAVSIVVDDLGIWSQGQLGGVGESFEVAPLGNLFSSGNVGTFFAPKMR